MRWRAWIIGFITTTLASGLFIQPTLATTSDPVTSLTVQTNLQTDGSVKIAQTISYLQPEPLNWTIFGNNHQVSVRADGQSLNDHDWQTSSRSGGVALSTSKPARLWRLDYSTTSALIRQNNRDQIYLKILQQPGAPVTNISVTFSLPTGVPNQALSGNIYSIFGSDGPQTTVISDRVIRYTGNFADSQAIFTISANWPKGVLQLSRWQLWRLDLLNLAAGPWLVLALLLPLLTLLVLLSMLFINRRADQPVCTASDKLPTNLSPILVGVLVNKKIHPEEIVALLVDLCQRGYLVIVKKNNQYYLSQRRQADEHLQNWEREIIDQLFPVLGQSLSAATAKQLGGPALFSPKVRKAFDQIYEVCTTLDFFAENPHLTRVRYKLIALGFYFAALIGSIWLALTGTSTYLLIPLIGTLILARLIMSISPQLIRYTSAGRASRQAWLAFSNYLGLNQAVGLAATQNHSFDRYLAYAIALHQTLPWANRFERSSTVIVKPDWFVSYEDLAPQDLATELVGFTEIISLELTKLHGPLVT